MFNAPRALALSDAGQLYVTEDSRHHILRFEPGVGISTFAGAADSADYLDASGTAARFNTPAGLAFDAGGNLLVADRGNHRIRSVSPAGEVSTLAGAGLAGAQDGTGETAEFDQPLSITVDSDGQVLVGEATLSTLRSIVSTSVTLPAASDLNGADTLAVAQVVSGLSANAQYSYYVLTQNSGGETTGAIQSFSTAQNFSRWAVENIGADVEQQHAALDDPDSDGLNNLLEYAFDTNPTQASAEAIPAQHIDAGFLQLDYRKRSDAADLSYTVSWSNDLISWSTLDVVEEILPDPATAATQWIRAKVPLDDGNCMFIRLTVSTLD